MTERNSTCALDCAARSMERASMFAIHDLKRGIAGLGAIARIATLLGAFSSTLTAMHWLNLPPDWCAYGDCAGGLADSPVTFLLSLPVAILAYGLVYYLTRRVAAFELEIRARVLETLNDLAHW